MKLGSLFDGIGTFPLSGLSYGFIPVWASEIEPFPIRVTQYHFPNMKHLGDITKINGAEIEPVDVIAFGSPCQDMSVAGKRAGLDGERSGLFSQAIRIIKEMRRATNGQLPRFVVWENVPGAFSSNGGQDFRAVLATLTDTEIPMPVSGGWAESGVVRTGSCDLAWRTLDAQYWGVPQRRKRIFLVADFAGQCAGEILFIEESLRWDSAESGETGQEIAGDAGDGIVEPSGVAFGFLPQQGAKAQGMGFEKEKCPTLRTGANAGVLMSCAGYSNYQESEVAATQRTCMSKQADTDLLVQVPHSSYWDGGQTSDCLDCSMLAKGQMMPEKRRFAAVLYDMTHADEVMRPVPEGIAPTLNSRMGTGGNQVPVMLDKPNIYTLDRASFNQGANALYDFQINEDGVTQTVISKGPGAVAVKNEGYAVRRLTPLECERLQGLPDGWTNIPGASDTARYKAIGNGIAKPCSDFVLGGIARVLEAIA